MQATNLPQGRKTYLDQNGIPLVGGMVAFYTPGTTDLSIVFLDPAMTTAAVNPVPLDAAGSLSVYAVGQFREFVTDVNGNVISDSIVIGSTPLTVTDAMLPVLEAATPADAQAILDASTVTGPSDVFSHLTITGDQTLTVAPTGNPPSTFTSFTVQGDTMNPNGREFMVNLGMNSQVGQGGPMGNDKVTLYAGIDAKPGSADVWSVNTVLAMEANSGNYSAQGFELDFNNMNVARGSSGNLNADFDPPVAVGLSISGASAFPSTSGLEVFSLSQNGVQWSRGITTHGNFAICPIQEWSTSPVGLQFDGTYSVAAINLTSLYNNPGAQTPAAMFIPNGMDVAWQSSDPTKIITDFVDRFNNRYVGLGSASGLTSGVFMGATTVPQQNGYGLGTQTNRWGDCYVSNLRLPNLMALTWDNNPAAAAGVVGFVADFVDNANNRVVGANGAAVFMGGLTAPISPGLDLGTPANSWGTVWTLNGTSAPSDPALKQDMVAIPSVLNAVNQVQPIEFAWKGESTKRYGFNAHEMHAAFGGHMCETHDGIMHIRRDELVSVLWKAVQELSAEVTELKKKPS